MTKRILIVDSDRAFAAALQEQLRDEGDMEPQVAASRDEAIQVLQSHDFDLTIVDMGVDTDEFDDDETRLQAAMTLIREIRATQPEMRLMLIPLLGEDLPVQAAQMDIQDTLPKPFFLDELLPKLERALALPPPRPQSAPVVPPPQPEPHLAPAPAVAPKDSVPRRKVGIDRPTAPAPARPPYGAEIREALFELVREIGADAAVLVGPGGLSIHEGILDPGRADALAQQVRHTLETSRHVSQFLEGASHPLAHQILEGTRTRLYIQTLSPIHALAVLTPLRTPLGIVRVNVQRTSRALQRWIEAAL